MTSQLLINEPPLQVLPSLARQIGLNEAIVLQQIHYWLNPQFNKTFFGGRHWVRNTYEKWHKQFPFFSERTLRRTIGILEDSGLLIFCRGGHLKQIKFYTINYDLLGRLEIAKGRPSAKAPTHSEVLETKSAPQLPALNTSISPSGQNGQSICPDWPDDKPDMLEQDPLKNKENQYIAPICPERPAHLANVACPSVQNDQPICPDWPPSLVKLATPSGQFDHFSYSENTVREYGKNILPPPLTPPPNPASDKKQEEEEEEKSKFDFESPNANSKLARELVAEEESREEAGEELPQTRIFQEMTGIWNQIVQEKLNQEAVHLTSKRQALMSQFLRTILASKEHKLEAWTQYCALIAGSRFLAGENASGFRVSLDWALIPEKAYKVLEGAIYDKPLPKSIPQSLQTSSREELEKEIRPHSLANRHQEAWIAICHRLAKNLGQAVFRSWFLRAGLVELTDTVATLQVDTLFTRDYIDSHYRFDVLRTIQALHPQIVQVSYRVVPTQTAECSRQKG